MAWQGMAWRPTTSTNSLPAFVTWAPQRRVCCLLKTCDVGSARSNFASLLGALVLSSPKGHLFRRVLFRRPRRSGTRAFCRADSSARMCGGKASNHICQIDKGRALASCEGMGMLGLTHTGGGPFPAHNRVQQYLKPPRKISPTASQSEVHQISREPSLYCNPSPPAMRVLLLYYRRKKYRSAPSFWTLHTLMKSQTAASANTTVSTFEY